MKFRNLKIVELINLSSNILKQRNYHSQLKFRIHV